LADLQQKLDGSLSKLQDGFETNKKKLEISKETRGLKKQVNDLSRQKAAKLTELGKAAYYLVRKGVINEGDLSELAGELQKLDLEIFSTEKKIWEVSSEIDKHLNTCSNCGTKVQADSKFCSGCGSEIQNTATEATIECHNCHSQTAAGSNFCGCCGIKRGE